MFLLFLIFFAGNFLAAAQSSDACPSPLNVGFRTVTFGSLKTGVWYPTTGAEAPYAYGSSISGSVALNAAPAACGRTFPLVVFSHGYGGCGTQSVFVTEQLARAGYLVAAPDHADARCSVDGSAGTPEDLSQAPFGDPASWTDQTYINRKNDIASVITNMLASAEFGPIIDPARIAGMGHSLGGYTILGMVGGWSSWVDPRIRAALLLSPYCEPYLLQKSVGNITVPVMYQGGTLDIAVTPFVAQNGGAYDSSPVPKFFAELAAAGHFAWTNFACSQAGTVAACLNTMPNARLINDYGFAFLGNYVNQQPSSLLWGSGSGLADYRHASTLAAVSAASFQAGAPLAPASIFSLFGEGLSVGTAAAQDPTQLPTMLAGRSVQVTDSGGTLHPVQLYFVSPSQINGVLPAGLPTGRTSFAVISGQSAVGLGTATVAATAPSLFQASTAGAAAGQAVYVNGGAQSFASLADASGAPAPIDLSAGEAYLVLYGTGLRAGAGAVAAQVASLSVPVYYAGPQNQYPGMDQVTLGPLPPTLAGNSAAPVVLTVAEGRANTVTISFR
jgi:uncharacterized protein (TIGR03437 family)